jgi:hypothetical protein
VRPAFQPTQRTTIKRKFVNVDYHSVKLVRLCGIAVLSALLAGNLFFCDSGKNRSEAAVKTPSMGAARVEKESSPIPAGRSDGSSPQITPFPLDSFGMGCACIWWLEKDSAEKVFFAQNDISGENPVITVDHRKTPINLTFLRLVEKEHGVEQVGDSIIQTWENEIMTAGFYCVKTFVCKEDSGSIGSELCEVTKFRGIVKITGKADKKERVYSILGDCGC